MVDEGTNEQRERLAAQQSLKATDNERVGNYSAAEGLHRNAADLYRQTGDSHNADIARARADRLSSEEPERDYR
mgnify:CR=1 FL=1